MLETVIKPKAKDLGDNFVVRRALPAMEKRSVGPFVFWDHMGPVTLTPEKELKVRPHPHIGLATITWLFSGEIIHRDSLGNIQPIRPGEVNWMTSGSGIVHSERSRIAEGELELEGIQLWLALPKEYEDIDASFYHAKGDELPRIKKGAMELTLVAGEGLGKKSPVPVYSDLFYFNVKNQGEPTFEYQLKDGHEAALYVIKGSVGIGGQDFERYDLLLFKAGEKLSLEIGPEAHFMFFGGESFPEKRHLFWNFVSSDLEKIEEAKKRWRNDEFPKVIDDEIERIPLPE